MRFLEIAGADLGRGNMRGNREHRHARAVAIEQAIDEVEIARAAAPGADRERAGRCASAPAAKAATSSWRTCSHSILPWRRRAVGQAVQAVADDAVDTLTPAAARVSTIWSATVAAIDRSPKSP